MRGSIRIATFFQIPVLIHWTFVFILAGAFYWGFTRGGLGLAIWSLGLILTLFFCVLLHEFGHALVAKRFGVTTKDIILSPIGGIARLTKLPQKPIQELLVAAAGPAVNIAIAILISPYYFLASKEKQVLLLGTIIPSNNVIVTGLDSTDRLILFILFLNIVLAVFNLLPAFPMDGGRILRALLSIRMERIRATKIAMYIGQAIAVLFIYFGVTEFEIGAVRMSFMIAFIGLFVFFSAASEYRYVKFTHLLKQTNIDHLFRRKITPFYAFTEMEHPVEAYAQGEERNFVIFDEWHNVIGILAEKKLKEAIKQKDFGATVKKYMTRITSSLMEMDSAEKALEQMQKQELSALPVYAKGKFVGILEESNLMEYAQRART